MDASILHHY